jgi:hypothetical protein
MDLDRGLREKHNTTSAIGLGAANRLPATTMGRKEEGGLVVVGEHRLLQQRAGGDCRGAERR